LGQTPHRDMPVAISHPPRMLETQRIQVVNRNGVRLDSEPFFCFVFPFKSKTQVSWEGR
jgi:hypothetical protein